MFRACVVAAGVFLAAASSVQAQTWTIDASHSAAQFAVRHMMVTTVRGDMGKITGAVTFDPAKPAAGSIEATVDVTAINTREAGRDKHLKSADFFDVEKFPTITFKSKKIDPAAGGGFKVTGDLTMKGVTKEVVLDVEPLRPVIKDQRGSLAHGNDRHDEAEPAGLRRELEPGPGRRRSRGVGRRIGDDRHRADFAAPRHEVTAAHQGGCRARSRGTGRRHRAGSATVPI